METIVGLAATWLTAFDPGMDKKSRIVRFIEASSRNGSD
jgi:hypothetical protein